MLSVPLVSKHIWNPNVVCQPKILIWNKSVSCFDIYGVGLLVGFAQGYSVEYSTVTSCLVALGWFAGACPLLSCCEAVLLFRSLGGCPLRDPRLVPGGVHSHLWHMFTKSFYHNPAQALPLNVFVLGTSPLHTSTAECFKYFGGENVRCIL